MLKEYLRTNAFYALSFVLHPCSAMGSCQLPVKYTTTPRSCWECLEFRKISRRYIEPQWRRGELDKTPLKLLLNHTTTPLSFSIRICTQ